MMMVMMKLAHVIKTGYLVYMNEEGDNYDTDLYSTDAR